MLLFGKQQKTVLKIKNSVFLYIRIDVAVLVSFLYFGTSFFF